MPETGVRVKLSFKDVVKKKWSGVRIIEDDWNVITISRSEKTMHLVILITALILVQIQ